MTALRLDAECPIAPAMLRLTGRSTAKPAPAQAGGAAVGHGDRAGGRAAVPVPVQPSGTAPRVLGTIDTLNGYAAAVEIFQAQWGAVRARKATASHEAVARVGLDGKARNSNCGLS